MRLLNKLALVAALLLTIGVARAATDTLTVTVNVTIAEAVDVVFIDGTTETTSKTWSAPGKVLDNIYDSAAAPTNLAVNVKNKGGIDVSVAVSLAGGAPWNFFPKTGFVAGKNKIHLTLLGASPVELPGTFGLAARGVAADTRNGSLELRTPLTSSTTNPAAITVTFLATNN